MSSDAGWLWLAPDCFMVSPWKCGLRDDGKDGSMLSMIDT
jgi:hypothetical protein